MSDLSRLSDEEYKNICVLIPHEIIVQFFKKNPQEFSKIRPGFRATRVQNQEALKLLCSFRDRVFISRFVGKIVDKWLKEIQEYVQKYQNNGEDEISSYIHTLYESYFAENVTAYFKLIEKEYNSDQLEMISNLVLMFKGVKEKEKELKSEIVKLKDKINKCKKEDENREKFLEKTSKYVIDLKSKIKEIESIQDKYQELCNNFKQISKEKKNCEIEIENLEKQIILLRDNVKNLQNEKIELEATIRLKIEKETEIQRIEPSYPLVPKNIDEFKENFSYNLESIGVRNSPLPIKKLLVAYLSDILFKGKPIICNKICVETLSKCISNTLVGNEPITKIAFSKVCDEKNLFNAINKSGRIVILDNFLGNYNETILISILDKFKSKIILLSVVYEKTLLYLPTDFLAYCYYINLSHISSFIKELIPNAIPSTIDEEIIEQPKCHSSSASDRNKEIIKLIALDFGYSILVSEKTTAHINDDLSACATLVFNLIPYVREVLGKNAFNISETLQRYVDHSNYKYVFEKWFMK